MQRNQILPEDLDSFGELMEFMQKNLNEQDYKHVEAWLKSVYSESNINGQDLKRFKTALEKNPIVLEMLAGWTREIDQFIENKDEKGFSKILRNMQKYRKIQNTQ